MLSRVDDYGRLCREFRWRIPPRYNMAADMCRHDPGAEALVFLDDDGSVRPFTFGATRRDANRYANVLNAAGVKRGERCAVMLGQSPQTAVAHLGALAA